MARPEPHRWTFKARFRRHALGWKSQPAIRRIKAAVAEIKKVARRDSVLAADGGVAFLERISPALEHVDGSSGAIGTAVNAAIAELVPLVAGAPAEATLRAAWLERLFDAHAADQIPYIEQLADHWGDLCASEAVAWGWADRLVSITRMALSADRNVRGHFHGTSACLSALFTAGRYDEIVDLVKADVIAWFRAVARKYSHKRPGEILADLVALTPGDEGKWFGAAKDAKLFDEAVALATRSPCAPQTVTRAARDFADGNPVFAIAAGLAVLRWLVEATGTRSPVSTF